MSDIKAEEIVSQNDKSKLSSPRACILDRREEANRALQKALHQSIARVVGHLKATGATDEEIRAARPGLISAQLTLGPVKAALDFVGITALIMIPLIYIGLAHIPDFVRRGGFLVYPLFWMSDWSQELAEATFYVFGLSIMLGLLLLSIYENPLTRRRVVLGTTLAQQAANQSKRLSVVGQIQNLIFIPSAIVTILFIVLSWRWSIAALSLGKEATWWDGILVALSIVWSLAICSFIFRRLPSAMEAVLCYRFPGFALLNALSEALDAVRDEHLWFDVEHRFLAARELAKAADILEGPMLRRFVEETGDKGRAVLGPKLATAAAALRKKLIWIATPMAGTRENLERFLRDAVVAAATGQVDRIGGDEVISPEATVALSQKWFVRLLVFVKNAMIAIIPLALVWSALKFGFMPLSSEADKATAQNAALLWFVLSIVRTLDPGGFKDVSEASGGWTERLSRSFGKGSK